MACYYPMHGWYSKTKNDSGKRSVTFRRQDAYIDMPITIPCGKCAGCKAVTSMSWAVRCYHESTQHLKNSFLTLTYDDEHIPADGKLVKKDLQNFFKRLRKAGFNIRYFACGEYGEHTRRPHYHVILFGENFQFDKEDLTDTLYTSETLRKIWGLGHVSIGTVTLQSIMYVVGYTQKKIADPDTFNLMSKRPSIGLGWIDEYKDDLIKDGFVVIDGKKFNIPKYYMDKYEEEFKYVKRERLKKAQENELGYNELVNKEINFKSRLNSGKKGNV